MTLPADDKAVDDSAQSTSKAAEAEIGASTGGSVSTSSRPSSAMAAEPAASSKKRGATRQINKDDDENDDGDDRENCDVVVGATIEKASDDVLKRRKIVKVARNDDGSLDWSKKKSSNPFASVSLTTKTETTSSLVGPSDTAGDKSGKDVIAGDPSSNKSSSSTAALSIFGVNAPFSGFGAVGKSSGSGFGSSGFVASVGFGTGSAGFGNFASAGSATSSASNTTNFAASAFPSFGSGTFSKGFGAVASDTSTLIHGGGNNGSLSAEADRESENDRKAFNFTFSATQQKGISVVGDDSTVPANEGDETHQSTMSNAGVSLLPTDYQIQSGEENEIVLLECRCKTHRWGPSVSTTTDSTDGPASSSLASAAVPPTESSLSIKTDAPGGNDSTLSTAKRDAKEVQSGDSGNQAEDDKDENKSNGKYAAEENVTSTTNPDMRWHEVGVGPLRVLQSAKTQKEDSCEKLTSDGNQQSSSVRLVQRRQVHTSSATKVLLNQRLFSESTITQPTDRHVKFTTPSGDGGATTYLFKCAKAREAKELATLLQQERSKASSRFAAPASASTSPTEKTTSNEKAATDEIGAKVENG
ncbi:hypothetical protein ACA910_003117 [Epithemia clementina (nom. ined.)]